MSTAPGSRRRRLELIDRDGSSGAARYHRAQRRAVLVVGLMSAWLFGCVGAALHSVWHVEDVRKFAELNTTYRSRVKTRRGDVVDRNLETLATDVRADNVTADPLWVRPPGRAAAKLDIDSPRVRATKQKVARIVARLTGRPFRDIHRRLLSKRRFIYLAKEVDARVGRTLRRYIERGDLPGVRLEPGFARYYPGDELAGLLLGRRNWSGCIERSYDRLLRGQTVEVLAYKDRHADVLYFDGAPDPRKYGGRSLVLTLDKRIQAVVERELHRGVREARADHGFAVVMDTRNAEVLAMATWPSVNPNTGEKPKWGWRNPIVQDQFEPGSTLKVVTLAAALDSGVATLHSQFRTTGGLRIGAKKIHKHPSCPGIVTAAGALECSSNVGMARIAKRVGKETLYKYLIRLGFGRLPDSGLAGEVAGMLRPPRRWSQVRFANIAFGQGIAVTALQMTAAMAAIGAGGIYRRPRLVRGSIAADGKRTWYESEPGHRVLKARTAAQVLQAMERVVRGEHGTGRRVRLADYRIAGKTGTAQQVDPGKGYSSTHWVASFVALAPADRPRLAIFVAIDTPRKRHPKYPSIVIRTGGAIAAPVVREIAAFTLPYLRVPPSRGAPFLQADDPTRARRLAAARGAKKAGRADEKSEELDEAAPARDVGARDESAPDLAEVPAPMPGKARVPDLRGKTLPAARRALVRPGLELRPSGSGVVTAQRPAAGVLTVAGGLVEVELERFTELAAAASGSPGGAR